MVCKIKGMKAEALLRGRASAHSTLEIIFKLHWLPSRISAPESLFITVIIKALSINKLLSKVLSESHVSNCLV